MKGLPGHDAGPSNRAQAMQIQTDADVNQTYIREMHSQDQVRLQLLCMAFRCLPCLGVIGITVITCVVKGPHSM